MRSIQVDASFVAGAVPPRRRDSHKGVNGSVCVVGGSRLYHGAPFLCATGAMRTGVDLVYLAVPAVIAGAIRSLSPDFIVIPLPDAKLTRGNVTKLIAWVPAVGAFAVGPGLGPQNGDEIASALNRIKGSSPGLVVDADALRPSSLAALKGSHSVVTPHAGEFERLFSAKLPEGTDERARLVSEKARDSGLVVMLKGPTDIISDGERVGLNATHSPAMTVGGTGDVLTGITAGLLSKGVPPFDAACSAAFINGSAGEEAAKLLGLHMTASDVANMIANVMKKFDRLV